MAGARSRGTILRIVRFDPPNSVPVAFGDMPANVPTLNGSMVSMAKRARQRSDSAAIRDPFGVIFAHTQLVRSQRTHVNLDCVKMLVEAGIVKDGRTTGAVLRALWQRSGLSMAATAKACGYRNASSVQRYFDAEYDEPLKPEVAAKLAKGLSGKGRPAIQAEEVTQLSAFVPADSVGIGLSEQGAAALVWQVLRRFGVDVELDDPELLRTARLLIALLKLTAARQELDDLALIQGLFAGVDIQSQNGSNP